MYRLFFFFLWIENLLCMLKAIFLNDGLEF